MNKTANNPAEIAKKARKKHASRTGQTCHEQALRTAQGVTHNPMHGKNARKYAQKCQRTCGIRERTAHRDARKRQERGVQHANQTSAAEAGISPSSIAVAT